MQNLGNEAEESGLTASEIAGWHIEYNTVEKTTALDSERPGC